MYRKELAVMTILALSLFVATDIAAFVSVKLIQRDAKYLATETCTGLSLVQQAIDRMQRNWSETCRLAEDAESKRVAETIEKINNNSTSAIWESYALQVTQSEEATTFEEMMLRRSKFLDLRSKFFQVLLTQQPNDHHQESPRRLLLDELLPAYEAYLAKSLQLMRLRFATGIGLSQSILKKTTLAEYAVFGSIISTLTVCAYLTFQMNLGAFRSWYRDGALK